MSEINTWDKTAANNNSAPPHGWPENMQYSQVNNSARENMAAVARLYADMNGTLVTTGSSNAYLLTPNRTLAAYTAGLEFVFTANNTNTGAATINVSSLGIKGIKNPDGTNIAASGIVSGEYYRVIYTGVHFVLFPYFTSKGLSADAPIDGSPYVRINGSWAVIDAIPAGAMMRFPSITPPTGWLKKNGAELSRATYSDLYAFAVASGNLVAQASKDFGNFGDGDGSTTFTIPEDRGEFERNWDDGRGIDSGRAIGSFAADELKSHDHENLYNHTTYLSGQTVYNNASKYVNTSNPKGDTGGGTETRPRSVAYLSCIKY